MVLGQSTQTQPESRFHRSNCCLTECLIIQREAMRRVCYVAEVNYEWCRKPRVARCLAYSKINCKLSMILNEMYSSVFKNNKNSFQGVNKKDCRVGIA